MSGAWALEAQAGASALIAPPANSQAAQIIHGWAVARRPTSLNMPDVSRRGTPVPPSVKEKRSVGQHGFAAHSKPTASRPWSWPRKHSTRTKPHAKKRVLLIPSAGLRIKL